MNDAIEGLKTELSDRYRFDRVIGQGGMATVYLAHDIRHDRKVAIKVLRPDLAATLGSERFLREIRIAAQLTHPHILPLHESGEASGLLFYIMPYIEGESLRDKLNREGELPIAETVRMLRDVVDALASAHKQQIVHRDIKPDNVLMSEGHALVTDFGVAKAVTEARGDAGLTTFGMAVGTPAYMSPEQASGDPNIDHRADLYAVGAMAYEMLTGHPPFEGASPQTVLAAHVSEPPKPVTEMRDAVPPQLAAVVMRCLEKLPADRFQTATELRAALEGIVTPSGAITPVSGYSTGIEQQLRASDPKRVIALYGITAVVVVAVAYVLMVALGLPGWVLSATIVLLAVGLPIVALTGRAERRRLAKQASDSVPGAEPGMSRWLSWRRVTAYGVAAFGGFGVIVTLYMAFRLLGIGPVGTLVAAGVLDERDRIVLAEFENRTADSTLGETVTQLLRIDLAQSTAVTVLEPVQIGRVLTRMERDPEAPLTAAVANDVAEREGLKAVVSGEILPVGTGFVVSSSLTAVATDEVLWAGRETAADAGGIIEAVDRLSASLRAKIGESLRTIRADAPLAQVTTRSTEALRKYAQADRANNDGDYDRALALLEEAVADDSLFAMAYRKIGVILRNWNQEHERAKEAFSQAYEMRDRLTDRERYLAEAAYHTYVTEEEQTAIAAYRTLLDNYPTDRIALNNLALAYGEQGRHEDAAELYVRSIGLGGAPAATFTNAIKTLYNLGYSDSARAVLSQFEVEYSNELQNALHRAAFASSQFDYETAESEMRAARAANRGNPMAEAMTVGELASYALIQGKVSDAMDLLLELYGLQDGTDTKFLDQPLVVFDASASAAIDIGYFGDRSAATETLRRLLENPAWLALDPEERDYLSLASLFAEAGEPERARSLLRRYQSEVQQEEQRSVSARVGVHQVLGAIALVEDRPGDAVREYRSAKGLRPACVLCELPEIAKSYAAAGEPDSAIAVYRKYLDTPVLFRTGPDNFNLWFAFLHLGELYEERRDVEQAIEHYNRFVDLWNDAEPRLQPRVQEARSRIADLVGEPS